MDSSDRVHVTVCARTAVGAVREHNEDVVRVGDLDAGELLEAGNEGVMTGERGVLAVVCDGMGGAAGGEVAATLAADAVWSEMRAAGPAGDRDVLGRHLRRAVRRANRAVAAAARADSALHGMGTTASAAAIVGTTLVLATVGDSRAYLLRAGRLVQITRDQSVVQALVSAGKLSEGEARWSERRGLILQALGAGRDVEVGLSVARLRRGDRLLLCSDGLHGVVGDGAIAHALAAGSPAAASQRLIELTLQAGAPDNVTVCVAEFDGACLDEPGDADDVEFAELDPAEAGERAVSRTSKVGRRLAARAGLLTRTTDELPATGLYDTVQPDVSGAVDEGPGRPRPPATSRLLRDSRLGLVAWLCAGLVLFGALVYILVYS